MQERMVSAILSDGKDTFQSKVFLDPSERELEDLMITMHRTTIDVELGTASRAVWYTKWEHGEPVWVRRR